MMVEYATTEMAHNCIHGLSGTDHGPHMQVLQVPRAKGRIKPSPSYVSFPPRFGPNVELFPEIARYNWKTWQDLGFQSKPEKYAVQCNLKKETYTEWLQEVRRQMRLGGRVLGVIQESDEVKKILRKAGKESVLPLKPKMYSIKDQDQHRSSDALPPPPTWIKWKSASSAVPPPPPPGVSTSSSSAAHRDHFREPSSSRSRSPQPRGSFTSED